MFTFRRISKEDAFLEFLTGNKAFDEKSPGGNLKPYLSEDILSGGEFFTYLLIEQSDSNKTILLGLVRYRVSSDYKLIAIGPSLL